MAPKKNVKFGDIELGPIQHQTLPADLIERIAHFFEYFTDGHQITDEARRLELLRALLLISTGAEVQETATLTRDQITELRYNF